MGWFELGGVKMKKYSLLSILMAMASLLFTQAAVAACGEIVIGSAISLTGKYATKDASMISLARCLYSLKTLARNSSLNGSSSFL